jgi:dCTP deaminase
MSGYGALPHQQIRQLITDGFIEGADIKNVGPASLDLTVSEEVYQVKRIVLPAPHMGNGDETIRSLLKIMEASPHDGHLAVGVNYLARCNERVSLPRRVYGYANPKSTSGRHDIHVRVIADRVPRYDALTPAGMRGEIWLSISPKSYPVCMGTNLALSQMRFFNRDTRFNEDELEVSMTRYGLVFTAAGEKIELQDLSVSDHDGSVILTLDLEGKPPLNPRDEPLFGLRARGSKKVCDLTVENRSIAWERYFNKLPPPSEKFIEVKRGEFYILSTRERVRVPPHLACEMVPMDERSGEFRTHYAGFIDPGWGCVTGDDLPGSPLTLEFRAYDDLALRHGQGIAKIRFEEMVEVPDVDYGTRPTSNYRGQSRAWLAKQFKQVT